MKAPDKIFAGTITQGIGVSKAWQCYPEHLENPIEYIRKDALMKWLEGKMTIEGATEGIVGGYELALKDVIKHIESL